MASANQTPPTAGAASLLTPPMSAAQNNLTQSQLAQPSSSAPSQQAHLQWGESASSNTLATKPPTAMPVEAEQDTEDDQSGGVSLFSEAGSLNSTTSDGMASQNHSWTGPAWADLAGPNDLPFPMDQDMLSITEQLTTIPLSLQDVSLDTVLASTVNGAETTANPHSTLVAPSWVPAILASVPPGFPQVLHIYGPDSEYDENGEGFIFPDDKIHFLDFTRFLKRQLPLPKDGLTRDLDLVENSQQVTREDVDADRCDIQGIKWDDVYLSREYVRNKRVQCEIGRRHVYDKCKAAFDHEKGIEKKERTKADRIRTGAQHFSFNRTNSAHHVRREHFQLRNLLTATSRNDIYYSTGNQVVRTDVYGSPADCVMDLSSAGADGNRARITTLAGSEDVLIAGCFNGEYAMTNLRSEYGTPPTLGRASESGNGITNHIHTFHSRTSGTTRAALCSNDNVLRVLDCYTDTFTDSFRYAQPINCSATSPNGRMRAVVGDFHDTLITNAETGKPFEVLSAHTDDVFACAWADDGIHVATSGQDHRIVVWDARNWSEPLTVLESELAVPRSLRFSPVGGGPRVLVSAEADDFVNIIDAVSWDNRQVIDSFGPITGITMTADGAELYIANSDPKVGGIMAFERDTWDRQLRGWKSEKERRVFNRRMSGLEWENQNLLDADDRVVWARVGRERRGVLGSEERGMWVL